MDWNLKDPEQVKRFTEMVECAKAISSDEYIRKLEMIVDGTNIHTRNKVKFYLNEFENPNSIARFAYGKHYDRLKDLKVSIYQALQYGDWENLKYHMKSWF